MTELRITVKNTAPVGGTFTTPFYFGFHDGAFDLFDAGAEASPGLEALAEDGSFGAIAAERLAVSPDSEGVVVAGEGGPIATQEVTSQIVNIDGSVNTSVSFGAMILPSNDAFVGTDDALVLFDEHGRFTGAQTVTFSGEDVYDAGTEVNTELDAAFINQTGPNTGVDENGVIRLHPGFNGSAGNPVGEGDQIILGGTNAFGAEIDPVAADFTLPGAQIAVVHINTVVERTGTDGRDIIIGRRDDDIVDAGAGNDIVFGGRGWDVIDGGAGRDFLRGGAGDDQINGGDGRDKVSGGSGDDLLAGGAGRDYLTGGRGDDTFLFAAGDGHDTIWDFDRRGDDVLVLDIEGVDSFADVQGAIEYRFFGVELDFGDAGSIFLARNSASSLTEDDFMFV
ncbi:MAG: spondin domain-containing protein [Pseudomonadota bacterium]